MLRSFSIQPRTFILTALLTLGASALSTPAHALRPPVPEQKEFHVTARLPESSRTCEEEASLWARRFHQATRLAVTSQQCRTVVEFKDGNQTHRLYSVALTYRATQEVHPYSAILGSPDLWGNPTLGRGIFATYAECLATLDQQALFFEANTGLAVVTGGCLPSQYTMESQFALQLDGYGTPRNKLRAFSTSFTGTVSPAMQAELQSLYVNYGGEIAFQTGDGLTFYYSAANNSIHYFYLMTFENSDHCLMQLTEARGIFEQLGSRKVVLGCLPYTGTDGKTQWIMEGARDKAANESVTLPSSLPYFSFDECMIDRDRAMAESRSRNEHPLGALCSESWDGKFTMEIHKTLFGN